MIAVRCALRTLRMSSPSASKKPRLSSNVLPEEPRVRTSGADRLARVNAHPIDKHIVFDEGPHEYRYRGQLVKISATTIKKNAFNPNDHFDGPAVVEKYFAGWKAKGPRSEYFHIIQEHADDEAAAKQAILDSWDMASVLGTELHRLTELLVNIFYDDNAWRRRPVIPIEFHNEHTATVAKEYEQILDWAASPWVAEHNLVPFRSELSVIWRNNRDLCVAAGQIDGLFVNEDDPTDFYILDWKRVKPKKMLTVYERAFKNRRAERFPHIPDTDYHSYSMQLSLYAVMMEQSHGYKIKKNGEKRMYLVRVHKDLGQHQLVECADYTREALELLSELESDTLSVTTEVPATEKDPAEEEETTRDDPVV